MLHQTLTYAVIVLLTTPIVSAVASQDWAAADRATRRLPPSAFPSLAAPIRADLERRGCTVPQPHSAKQPANVVRGHFVSAASDDWAVLCSRERGSVILVYRDGAASPAAELARDRDAGYLQTVDGNNSIGFSRGLGPVNPDFIRRHRNPTDPPLPPLDHDGIDDAFIGKGSKVHYFFEGKWVVLKGSD